MQIFFDTPEFDAQLLRALSYTFYQGADIGDCLSTAARIKPKDFDSWFDEWSKTAERIYCLGENSRLDNCGVSAMQSFLRASNYYRAALFFLYFSPPDERLMKIYDRHCLAFEKALAYFATPVEAVQIPYENTTLPGYFYKAEAESARLPTFIVNGGYDSTHQEGYFAAGAAALSRGYNVLCFDGPGQGGALIKQNLHMRPDWEKVITPVVDFLTDRKDVDAKKIVLYGPSWGGYLAPRAAAFERRLAALVVNPGQYDAMEALKRALPDIGALLDHDPDHLLEKYLGQVLVNPLFAAKMKAKMFVHGMDSMLELIRSWRDYNLQGLAKLIACPTLVMDSENEPLSTGQAKQLFEELTCRKEYVMFSAKDGAGEHCEAGALSLAHQYLFDWLDG